MSNDPNIPVERNALSLFELNRRVRNAISGTFPEACWVQAETSDVRVNPSSGHCYLEFIEKHATTGQLIAKARGTIWANMFRGLKPYFEKETGQPFSSGLKVLVKVVVDYHELYGFNLTVVDIDPVYTLGDMVRKRMEIIRRLQEEGVFSLNRELPFPALPQRIAVITSPTAAGYEDFLNQLSQNKAGYSFYTKLIPAVMQGEKTEESVIAALDYLYSFKELFNVVVIIRGGGSTSDLSSFDSYLLAANCAQYPLPIITGIGHERDDTVVDMVAHTRMKTPTAVAEFLISRMDQAAEVVAELQQEIRQLVNDQLNEQNKFLQNLATRLPALVSNRLERNRVSLQGLTGRLPAVASTLLSGYNSGLGILQSRLNKGATTFLTKHQQDIQLSEQFIRLASPEYILKRGYSLAVKDGKIVKQASALKSGDKLTTRFPDGEVYSVVE